MYRNGFLKDAYNPPNLLTYARIAVTPLIGWWLLTGQCERAFWLMIAGGLTDALDGMLARRFGWVSRLGAYLDPVADKLLMTTLYLSFSAAGLAPVWLALLVIGRDALILSMVAGAFLITDVREFPPSVPGKLSTFLQIVTAATLAFRCAYPSLDRSLDWLIWTTAAVTVWSGADYVLRAKKSMKGFR